MLRHPEWCLSTKVIWDTITHSCRLGFLEADAETIWDDSVYQRSNLWKEKGESRTAQREKLNYEAELAKLWPTQQRA